MPNEEAEILATRALAWLAADPDLMAGFFGSTGLGPQDVAAAVTQPEGLAAIMDYIFSDDHLVLRAAEHLGVSPEKLIHARAQLPGGDLPHWT